MQVSSINGSYGVNNSKFSFGRKIEEHRSWGGNIDPSSKEVSFKILTFEDARRVGVKVYDAKDDSKFTLYPLKNKGNGVFQTEESLSPKQAKEGTKYSFVIEKADGTTEEVKDPYAKRQGNTVPKDFLGYSILYDHSKFDWQNQEEWNSSDKRIVRNPKDGALGVRNASIYEMQIDTLTKEGTFEAAKEKLHEIKESGFNTIEIMPNENTFSFNWGYDGVDKFAVPEHRGGPDKLKELIDYAHGLEMNVVMDYVPNHLGPDGAQLKRTGPYIKGPNAFGEAFNFEGDHSKYVRDYIVNAGMNWVENYHVDGLRLDMTKFMESDFTMKEIAAEINYHYPDVFLIAEDSREHVNVNEHSFWVDENELHDKRVVNPLTPNETCEGKGEDAHCAFINKIDNAIEHHKKGAHRTEMLRNLGYDSEWDFSFHHKLNDAIYTRENLDGLMNAIYHSQNAVKYVTSHDETGNMDGTRSVVKYMVPKLNLNSNIILNEQDMQRAEDFSKAKGVSFEDAQQTVTKQKAQSVAESIATMYVSGVLEDYKYASSKVLYDEILKDLGVSKNAGITYRRIASNFKRSAAQHRMAQALTYAIPGPKMVFQGDENLDLTPFRFFRQFEHIKYEPGLKVEKGYEPGRKALKASTLGNIKYSAEAKETMVKFNNLTEDLNKLNRENPALTTGYLVIDKNGERDCVVHSDAIAIHTKDEQSGNEFFVVTNFKNECYPSHANGTYNIEFPEGEWVEVLNTDDSRYGGTGRFSNEGIIKGYGLNCKDEDKQPINMNEFTTIYFKRVD